MNENEIEILAFSYNWNNKLNNKAFTSLRLHNDTKFQTGKQFRIILNGKMFGIAELREKRVLRFDQLNPFITFLDTGYGVEHTINLIKTMYKNKNINWDTQLLDFCLFLYENEQKEFF
jgi:hypothetical protein